MSGRYRSFLRICERWPLDPAKGERRDLGVVLRKRISEAFKQGENTNIENSADCDRILASLDALCSDKHRKQYQRNFTDVGALGLDLDTVKASLTEQAVEEYKEQNKTFLQKWKKKNDNPKEG